MFRWSKGHGRSEGVFKITRRGSLRAHWLFHLREISRALFRNYASRLHTSLKRKDTSSSFPSIVRFDISVKKGGKVARKEYIIIFLSANEISNLRVSFTDYLESDYL